MFSYFTPSSIAPTLFTYPEITLDLSQLSLHSSPKDLLRQALPVGSLWQLPITPHPQPVGITYTWDPGPQKLVK